MRGRPLLLLAGLVLALSAPAMVAAQSIATSALKGHDSRAPIDVDADRIEVLDAESSAIFTGNVRVRQGGLTIESQRLRIIYERPAKGDPVVRRMDAEGDVRLRSPTESARARFAIYDVDSRILTLIGGVQLQQQQTRLEGNRLTMDLDTGRSTLDGRTAAGGSAGRVTGRFAVPERKATP
ncbi:LptA/OstA family protein [Thermaurantiacus sp.]